MKDEEERQTPAAQPLSPAGIGEQMRARLALLWKPLLFTLAFFFLVFVFALWLAFANHGQSVKQQASPQTPQVSASRLDAAPPPAPVIPHPTPPPAQSPDVASKATDQLNSNCNGLPCQQQQQNGTQTTGMLTNPAATITPQQDYEQKLKQYELAAAMATPDEQLGDPPTPQPTQSAVAPPQPQKEPTSFPPVSTPEQEIGQERNASYNSSHGPLYRLFGKVDSIPARLDNEIIGDFEGPLQTTVIRNVWNNSHEAILIPQGAKLIGRYHPVSDGDQERLQAEVFEVWMPDGWVTTFDTATVLSASGATGLTGKVNHHYAQVFLTAIGISAVTSTAQIGNYQTGFGYDPGVEMRNSVTRGGGEAAQEVLGRRARIPNTIKVPTGTLIDLPLSNDLVLPEWRNHTVNPHI